MNPKWILPITAFVLAGCATQSGVGVGAGVGALAGNLLGAIAGVHRTVTTAAGALVGGALGYQRSKANDARLAEREAQAIREESGLEASISTQELARGDPGEAAADVPPPLMSLEINVRQNEMLTPDGALHPRAALALTRMDYLVQEHGGEFEVYVPLTQRHTVDAIRDVAPHATIIESKEDESYRLVVVPERG